MTTLTLWAPAALPHTVKPAPADPLTQIAAALATLQRSSLGYRVLDYTDLRVFADTVRRILEAPAA
jgi:hypothetical protein